jgi:hypothetical protein
MKDIVFLLAIVGGTWAAKYHAPSDDGGGNGTLRRQVAANVQSYDSEKAAKSQYVRPKSLKNRQQSVVGNTNVSNSLMLWDYWDESTSLGFNNIVYSISVGIGSNNQQFSVLLHLGTTDFWVPSQACTTNGCAGCQNFANSATLLCSNPPESWSSYYLLGTPYYPLGGCVSGYIAEDTVNLAGITIPNMPFGLATEVDTCITNSVRISSY